MKKVAFAVVVLLVVCSVVAYLVLQQIESAARGPFERHRENSAKQLDKHRTAFLEDQRWYANLPWVTRPASNPPLEDDAASLFNDALDWHGAVSKSATVSILRLPQSVIAVLESDEWLTAPLSEVALDDTWWTRLAAFERWSLDRVGPLQEALDGPLMEFDPLVLPSPNYLTLRNWTRLHVRSALSDPARSTQVAEDLQHLTRLMLTTEDTIAGLMAGAILRNALEAAQHSDVDEFEILSSAELDRFNRVVRASAFLLSASYVPEYFDLFETMPTGHCLALNESMVAGLYRFQPIMIHVIPEYFDNATQALATHSECRAAVTRHVWNNRPWLKASMAGKNVFEQEGVGGGSSATTALASDSDIFTVAESPRVSRYVSWTLLGIVGPAPFVGYDE